MKKSLLLLLAVLFLFSSCGDDAPAREEEMLADAPIDSIPTLKGEFIYLQDAAVLKGADFIYGVEIDSISKILADSVEALKRDEFHMIPIEVKAKIIKNPRRDGWEELIQIREIIKISVDENKPEITPQVEK